MLFIDGFLLKKEIPLGKLVLSMTLEK